MEILVLLVTGYLALLALCIGMQLGGCVLAGIFVLIGKAIDKGVSMLCKLI